MLVKNLNELDIFKGRNVAVDIKLHVDTKEPLGTTVKAQKRLDKIVRKISKHADVMVTTFQELPSSRDSIEIHVNTI